jgi:predicted RNA binding protein YcfA (HicA-like mRNA interferase family)
MLKTIPLRKLIAGLRRFDFVGPFPGGRHMFMVKEDLKIRLPNPHGRDIGRALLAEILREAGISRNEWNEED